MMARGVRRTDFFVWNVVRLLLILVSALALGYGLGVLAGLYARLIWYGVMLGWNSLS